MQLEKLVLTDIGTFAGRQTFDLSPRVRYGAKRPIVLFGGLNGSGKTTFLTAVRLALYGRHSVEAGTTQKEYENILKELIHRPANSLIRVSSASISLEFTYARLGERVLYRVLRTWHERASSIEERLSVFRDNDAEEVASGEQAQAFLNQMIPSGISQFFFFDGEKIAALARDESDAVLADAIRRLLGLDLADRLSNDLSVFLRQRHSVTQKSRGAAEIAALESELKNLEEQIAVAEVRLKTDLVPARDSARERYHRRKGELMDRGGAWAVDREKLSARLDELKGERQQVEDAIRLLLEGIVPFSLTKSLLGKVKISIEKRFAEDERRVLAKALEKQANLLKVRLAEINQLRAVKTDIDVCIDKWLSDVKEPVDKAGKRNDYALSDLEARNILSAINGDIAAAKAQLAALYNQARRLTTEEDKIQEQLANAPSEESLKDAFAALTLAAEEVARKELEYKNAVEEIRRTISAAIEVTRKLGKLASMKQDAAHQVASETIAQSLQELIVVFKSESAKEKCKALERHFVTAFARLSRKDDIVCDVRIDSTSFAMTLLDQSGTEIQKKRLSAGEKQIYAISMLEALAKTSGRNLPIIIDTPLGRLDSKHRQKLVESYFPTASHQVVILSTDTEVDQAFYQGLQPHLSHAYHLSFDQSIGATKVEEGYFWRHLTEEGRTYAA